MSRYPAAVWKRLPGVEPRIRPRTVIFHTMVGSLPGTDAFFRSGRSGGIESHFGVGGPWEGAHWDGLVYQWRDTEEQADANFHANGFAVSIETSDGGDHNRPWSPKQIAALVALGRWLAKEHDIPPRQCRTPTDSGFGWHVMFGAPSEWTPVAKVCPGQVRIRQLREVVFPAIFGDEPIGDDMYDDKAEDRLFARIEAGERRTARYVDHGDAETTGSGNHHAKILEELGELRTAVATLATVVGKIAPGSVAGDLTVSGTLHVQDAP